MTSGQRPVKSNKAARSGEWRVPFAQIALGEPEWEETHATPPFLGKSAQPIEDKEFQVAQVVYGEWKSAQEYDVKGFRWGTRVRV